MQGKNEYSAFDNRSEYHVAHLLNHYVRRSMGWDEVPEAVMISVLNFIWKPRKTEVFRGNFENAMF